MRPRAASRLRNRDKTVKLGRAGSCVALAAIHLVFRATLFTNSIDLKGVPGGEIVIFLSNFLFQLAYFRREKLNGTSALRANHVVMAAAVVLMLVTGDTVVERNLAGKSTLGKQLQRAIDGGIADTGIFPLNQAVQLVDREMIAGFEKRSQDSVSLRGLFQPHTFEMLMKNILRLAHHLPRDGGLIVDAPLQHEKPDREPEYHCRILKMKFNFRTLRHGGLEYNQRFA
jgi:hypothetical protein